MDAILNIDASSLAAELNAMAGILTPSNLGPFQDSLGEALEYLMVEGQVWYRQESDAMGLGEIWPDLAISTKKGRARRAGERYYPGIRFPILYENGYLFNSLNQGNSGNELIFTEDSATQQTIVKFAFFHQFGTAKMPQRQFVWPPDERQLAGAQAIIVAGASSAISSFDFPGGAAFSPAPF